MTAHIKKKNRPLIVCPTCEGRGQVGPGFVYTQDDIDEQWGADREEFYDHMRDLRAGLYDRTCPECGGRNVVVSDCSCERCESERREIADMEAMERAERAFGC